MTTRTQSKPKPARTKSVRVKSPRHRGDESAKIAQNRAKHANLSNVRAADVALITEEKVLTDKAKAFIKLWAQGESISSAAARAGYADGAAYAYKLVHLPQVKALYAEEKRLYEEASQMTRKKVMDGLLEGIEMAKLMAEPATVINGWKTVGQMCGYFEPVKKRIELNVTGQVFMGRLEQLSDAELMKMLTQNAPQLVEELTNETPGLDDPEN